MFHKREDQLYEKYDDYSSSCCQCTVGCCDGIKNMFHKIKSYRFKKVKPSNKHLSKILLGDDY